MRIVITHPEYGIYLGSFLGLGFWSKISAEGQEEACTFKNEELARDYIATWEENGDPAKYGFAEVATDAPFATIAELDAAGLEDMTGPMKDARLDNMEPAGFC
ncbi:hypothetical protein ACEUZ9_000882 [Paracoccus litorisediminis]|uniref:hypothetical protein n=1 Tax=Paracoccus litorisediminis TaxID=2006130 RepID=UPI00373339CD